MPVRSPLSRVPTPAPTLRAPAPTLESIVRRLPLTMLVAALTALLLAACAGADADDAPETAAQRPGVVEVDAGTAVDLLDDRSDLTIIDVRTPEEFAEGHLSGAELVDIYEPAFTDEIDGLDRDGSYLLYCRTGNRSGQAAAFMEELGFTEVYNAGGLVDLADAGAAVQR